MARVKQLDVITGSIKNLRSTLARVATKFLYEQKAVPQKKKLSAALLSKKFGKPTRNLVDAPK